MLKYLLAAITSLIVTTAYADVTYNKDTHTVSISGYTTHEQSAKLYHILKENEVAVAILSGPGGDYYAGLKMGDMLAYEGLTTVVRENTTCVSACAFMALAGEKIIVDGEVMFHVPYFMSFPTNVTILKLAQKFGEGYIDMVTYLIKRGSSTDFARQLMTQTSNCKFIVVENGEAMMDITSAASPTATVYYKYLNKNKCK